MASPIDYIPLGVDISATALGAIVGALAAARARFDINGALIVAVATGLGGGIIRDLLLDRGFPVALSSPWLLPTAIVAGVLTFLFSRQVDFLHGRVRPLAIVLDALFLGLWTIVGTAKAFDAGLPYVSCVFLGVMTGVGGGVLRDILLNRQPSVLRPGTLEAGASLVGAIVQAGVAFVVDPLIAALIGFVIVVGVRLLSVFLRWETPPARIAPPEDTGDSRPPGIA